MADCALCRAPAASAWSWVSELTLGGVTVVQRGVICSDCMTATEIEAAAPTGILADAAPRKPIPINPQERGRHMVEFNQNHRETIQKIVDRAVRLTRDQSQTLMPPDQRLSLTMDLMAANGRNGNAVLDLDALLEADDFNFAHDVFGIARHMDRDTGRIGDHFSPRFAVAAFIGEGGM